MLPWRSRRMMVPDMAASYATYALTEASGLVDPMLFNTLRGGKQEQAEVADDGSVTVQGVRLVFREAPLPHGTKVRVWLARDYICATEEDLAADASRREAQRLREQEQRRRELNQLRSEAEAVNGLIRLPFQWTAGIKDVLSGLSENSVGDGRNRATVNHILLLDDADLGRLKRKKGNFLCTSQSGSDGKRWSNQVPEARAYDGDGNTYTPRITCSQCLKLAEGIMSKEQRQLHDQAEKYGLSVTNVPNRPVSGPMQRKLFDRFKETGDSFHSPRGETVWAVTEACKRERIPYRVEMARINGTPTGIRVVRTDRHVPGMILLPETPWSPVTEELKRDPNFMAIGRDKEGREYIFWNGGGDWLREDGEEGNYSEDLCYPVEWKTLCQIEVLQEWKPEAESKPTAGSDFSP